VRDATNFNMLIKIKGETTNQINKIQFYNFKKAACLNSSHFSDTIATMGFTK